MRIVLLSQVAEVAAGQGAPQSPSLFSSTGKPFVRAGSLDFLLRDGREEHLEQIGDSTARQLKLRLFPPNTILFAKSGMSATLGRIYKLRSPCYVVNHLAAIIPGEHLDSSYLTHWFRVNPPSRLIPNESYPSIRLSDISRIKLSLPPLPEQKRIAAILDKADEIRRKREKAIELTDSFLRSVFLEMFGDPVTNTKGWDQFALGELVDFKTGKLDSNAAVPDGKYPFFTCARETYWIDTFAFDCKALLLAGNNAEGKYSVKLYEGKFNAYQRTYVMTLKRSELNYEYLKYVIESKLNFLRHHSKGTNTKYLTLALLQSIKIQVPDRSLQDQFARLFDRISKQLTERYQQSSSLLESLASSLNFHVFDQSRSDKPQQFATKQEAYAL